MSAPHDIRCVALDFDLTIFDYRQPEDTRILAPWFALLASRGIQVGIASGRTVESLRFELEKLSMPWMSPFPAFAIHEEAHIHSPEPSALIAEWNQSSLETMDRFARRVRPYFEACAAQCAREGIPILEMPGQSPAGVTMVLETPAAAEALRLSLSASTAHEHDLRVARNHHILMATPASLHKGAALGHFCRSSGIDPLETLAIGDNLNDLCLFEQGFRCATVQNADPLVKEAVLARQGFVAPRPIAFGVLEIFEHHFPHLSPADR